MLSNVSTIVRLALMWVGYVLREKVVEVVRHGPLSEPGASLDAPEAPDEPKATQPRRWVPILAQSLLRTPRGLCGLLSRQRRQPRGGATCARPSQVATVYTNDPKQLREAISTNLCTLLRLHICLQQRNSVHKCPKTAPRGHFRQSVYTPASPRPRARPGGTTGPTTSTAPWPP